VKCPACNSKRVQETAAEGKRNGWGKPVLVHHLKCPKCGHTWQVEVTSKEGSDVPRLR
jgi:transposase-like protein